MQSILVVEDDVALQKLYGAIIRSQFRGVELFVTSNGAEALEECRRITPSAILSDIEMPVMNGLDFYRRLKEEFPEMVGKTAFVSGAIEGTAKDFIHREGRPYLPKPFKVNELETMIRTILTGAHEDAPCKRRFPRIARRETCLLIPPTYTEPLLTETIDYSDGGLAVRFEGSQLPTGMECSVRVEALRISSRTAQVVWSRHEQNETRAGLQWR